MTERSRSYEIRIQGDIACFSRPELKTERVSYPIPTPSAIRGILEAIVWKPAVIWRVEEIQVLSPIRYLQFRRNEVNERASDSKARSASKSGEPWNYYADDDRAQRNTVALRGVDYVVRAYMELTTRKGPGDNIRKFEEMFERRLEKGQHVTPPVLGCREFPCSVEAASGRIHPIQHSEDLGWILHDIRFGKENRPVFFHAVMTEGIVRVPPFPERGDVAK